MLGSEGRRKGAELGRLFSLIIATTDYTNNNSIAEGSRQYYRGLLLGGELPCQVQLVRAECPILCCRIGGSKRYAGVRGQKETCQPWEIPEREKDC